MTKRRSKGKSGKPRLHREKTTESLGTNGDGIHVFALRQTFGGGGGGDGDDFLSLTKGCESELTPPDMMMMMMMMMMIDTH